MFCNSTITDLFLFVFTQLILHYPFIEKPPYFGCPNGRVGLLSSMYTEPSYRRKGIAKELLTRVINEARLYGCGTVQITASDKGRLLYTDFGFVKHENFMHYKL